MSTDHKELRVDRAATSRLGLTAVAVLTAVAMSPAVYAAEPSPGLRVFKDPATGQLRAPTHEELAAERASRSLTRAAPSAGLITGKPNPQAVFHLDGTVEQELDDSSLMYSMATRAADGSVNLVCVTGAQQAESVLKGRKATAKSLKQAREHSHDK